MSNLFAEDWMQGFMNAWNADQGLCSDLEKINFSSTIAYGFVGEDNPRGFLQVENGKATACGAFNGETLNWDLRASEDNWNKWLKKPPGMMGLGMAYSTRKLQFNVGDYGAMVKDPRMAGPFIKTFSVMGQV